jgi:hypothetical protein
MEKDSVSEMPEEVLDQARGTSAGNGLPQPGKSVSFEQPPDGGGPAVAGGGGRVHPEYAKLAEERLKAATARIVSLETEVQLATKRVADEQTKTALGEQQIVKLNARVAQVGPHANVSTISRSRVPISLNHACPRAQANELLGKMKDQQEEMNKQREADCKELVDLRQKQKSALALVKQLQDTVQQQKIGQEELQRQKVKLLNLFHAYK